MSINQKLSALREKMIHHEVDAVIIPSSDPHISEYIAATWKDREWISGFTGSAGIVIVTKDKAGLWTDSRYFIQAEKELKGTEIILYKLGNQFAPEHLDWLKNELPQNGKIAIDGFDFSKTQVENIQSFFKIENVTVETKFDIISEIWIDRPTIGGNEVYEHDEKFVGNTRKEKLQLLRDEMKKSNADYYLINALDEVAWTLNIRGKDVEYNPVVISYLVVTNEVAIWFVGENRINENLKQKFSEDGIEIRAYEDLIPYLNNLSATTKLLTESTSVNYTVYKSINAEVIFKDSPARILKGEKTESEVTHIKETMIGDGVALAYAFRWLEDELKTKSIGEYEFAKKIAEERAKIENYAGESFGAIIGYNANGAIVHYHPTEADHATIKNEGVLLVDCGGQYFGGTTDITRTVALSPPTPQVKHHFTLVLKGHIALAEVIFPKGTSGSQLEVLARQYMWDNGLNYLHGTGHGIGYFLNVHEGPHGLAVPTTDRGRTPLTPGMIISNEPGYYLEGSYGIRIENVVVVRKHRQHENYMQFETISLYPIDLELADEKLLTSKEKAWINKYNEKCFQKISPNLSDDMKTWFRHKCKLLN